jgi:hypothetical protein
VDGFDMQLGTNVVVRPQSHVRESRRVTRFAGPLALHGAPHTCTQRGCTDLIR